MEPNIKENSLMETELDLRAKLGLVYPRELGALESNFQWWEITDQLEAMRNIPILPSFHSRQICQCGQVPRTNS
jgi:hypothetical protein